MTPPPASSVRPEYETARATRSPRLDEILKTSAAMFRSRGYDATSLYDIAKDLRMSKAGLYNYIGSKTDLLHALMHDVLTSHVQLMEDVQTTDGDVVHKLTLLVERHVRTIVDNFADGYGFYVDVRQHLDNPQIADLIALRVRYERYIEELLARGKAEGCFCPDLDVFMGQVHIVTSLNSIFRWYDHDDFHWWRKVDKRPTPEEFGRTYTTLIVGGLYCRTADHSPCVRS